MASLRDIRKRIRSVKSTRQITKAMKMVAAARLRRAQEALLATRPYTEALDRMIKRLVPADATEAPHPLLTPRPVRHVHLVLFTSDKGLAGGFNANAIRTVNRYLEEETQGIETVRISTVGRKGYDFFRRRPVKLEKDYAGFFARPPYQAATELGRELVTEFETGKADAVYLVYNEFLSAISQRPTRAQLLPLVRPAAKAADGAATDSDFLYEPSQQGVLERLVPQAVNMRLFRAILESVAAEHGARMSAMENATNNARDLIDALTLTYNRTRQAVITKELMEIVSGAEALK
jgi:F-type H+-transporting ATPase subunit gamma